jgi:hypothetical protein
LLWVDMKVKLLVLTLFPVIIIRHPEDKVSYTLKEQKYDKFKKDTLSN